MLKIFIHLHEGESSPNREFMRHLLSMAVSKRSASLQVSASIVGDDLNGRRTMYRLSDIRLCVFFKDLLASFLLGCKSGDENDRFLLLLPKVLHQFNQLVIDCALQRVA